jgi:hypothetical protein
VGALVAAIGLCVVPAAVADDWARDRAAIAALDPAIRTAIEARTPVVATVSAADEPTVVGAGDRGFAWDDAFVGAAVAIAGMCAALACVTLVRHDGRLRST